MPLLAHLNTKALPLALQPFVGVGFLNQVIPCLPIQHQSESDMAL